MGRGRPRGNQTQRDIGRAVGKGLSGTSPQGCGCLTFLGIWIAIFIILWISAGFLEAVMMMEVITVGLIILFLIFSS